MKPTTPFDALDWLNRHRGAQQELSRGKLDNVLCFSLMWNVFEAKACGKNAYLGTIYQAVDRVDKSGRLSMDEFRFYLTCFQKRYLEDGEPNHKFDSLSLERGGDKQLVANVLQGKSTDAADVVKALLLVVYRLRNNMFHGEKYVFTLPPQDENFGVVNGVLATFLDRYLAL